MGKIQEMSMDEIIEKIGANLVDIDFHLVFHNNQEVLDRLTRLMKRLDNTEGLSENGRIAKIEDFFRENEQFADKECLAVITLFNTQRTIDKNLKNKKLEKELRKYVSNGIRMLDGENITVYKQSRKSRNGNYNRLDIINSRKLVECIKSKNPVSTLCEPSEAQKKRMEQINEYVGDLDTVVMELKDRDIMNIIAVNPLYGKFLLQLMTSNTIRTFEDMHPELDLEKLILENGRVPKEIDESEDAGLCQRKCRAIGIIENSKNIDMDKLLLMIGYRMIEDLENGTTEVKSDEGEDLLTKDSEYCIELFRCIISNIVEMCGKDTEVSGIEAANGDKVDYSAEELAEDFLRFRDGRYISKSEVQALTDDILNGKLLLQDVPEEMRVLLAIEQEQYESFMANSVENFVYTINNYYRSTDEIFEIIEKMEKIPGPVLEAMASQGILFLDDAISFYENGKISLDQMKSLDIMDIDEEREKLTRERVKEIYCVILKLESDENMQDEYATAFGMFSKYVGLYRAYNFEGKSDDEIDEISNDLIGDFEDVLNDRTLKDLYQYGLISLNSYISWGGNLLQILSEGSAKPNDLKKLYANGTIGIEQIKDVLRYRDVPNDEKLDLICSTFDGESEEEEKIRDELIQLLPDAEEYRDTYRKTGAHREKGNGTKKRELVSDPQARWKLISLIDNDYSKRFLPDDKSVCDGHRIFFLPNHNSVIIEKMYERKKGKMVPAHNKATYIMDTDVLFDNIDDIIIGGAVNRTFLVRMSNATGIDHNTAWGRKIREYFNICIENPRYKEEDIAEFLRAEERFLNSRKERE